MKTNISLEEAQGLLFAYSRTLGKEVQALQDTLDRVLAQDILAPENIPPFDRSPYDGYAYRTEDVRNASEDQPVTLMIIEEVPAGYAPTKTVVAGTAVKILTGAPIPEGADTVIKYEETEYDENKVLIRKTAKAGVDIVRAGEDVKKGEVIARQGTVITPPIMGLLSSIGVARVPVYQRPRVAIVSTGDELVDVTEKLEPGKIRNSNSYTLLGYLQSIGAEPIYIGIAKDTTEEVAARIVEGLQQADLVLTTGGVSVGDYDVVKNAVQHLGAETLYWKIEIKPGSATLAAVKGDKMVIGLSGNPAAAMVILQLLTIPLIKKMAGRTDYQNQQIEIYLKGGFRKPSPRRRFLRGKLVYEKGVTWMEITGAQGNGVLSSMVDCNVMAEIPEGSGPIPAGEKLTAYLVD